METDIKLTKLASCAGCGAKVGAGTLVQLLEGFRTHSDPRLLVGYDRSDDASVYYLDENTALVQTTDFFPPIVDDPFLYGQIAAANAISDVYAMGGEPKLALNLLCFPNCLGIEVAGQILAGGADRCQLAGCVVAGGHSINDHEPKYGLSVTGFVQLEGLLANAGAKVGDALVLTKALGTGVITTAYKGGLLDEIGVRVATDSMIRLNDTVGRVGGDIVRHACTDVTGFSLMGHSCEMAEASGVTLRIDADAVPMLDGAREMARMGMLPAGAYRNRDFFGPRVQMGSDVPLDLADVLFDPQTSGGLLVSVDASQADALVSRLCDEGLPAAVIGQVAERGQKSVEVR